MKVVLCDGCIKKLLYKRTNDRETSRTATASITDMSLQVVSMSRRATSGDQREPLIPTRAKATVVAVTIPYPVPPRRDGTTAGAEGTGG